MSLFCRLGFHDWSSNRNGVRICLRCPAVDRYYGLTGLIRYMHEKDSDVKKTDTELREWWLKYEKKN